MKIIFIAIFLIISIYCSFKTVNNYNFEFSLDVDNIKTEEIKVGNKNCLKITIGKNAFLNEEGKPEVPIFRHSVILPTDAEFDVEIKEISSHEIPLAGVMLPSRGQILRNIKKEFVPYKFGEQYSKNEFYPKKIVEFSTHKMRDIYGGIIEFHPIRYNAVTGKLIIVEKINVILKEKSTDRKINKVHDNVQTVDRDFYLLYKKIYSNFEWYDDVFLRSNGAGRILVIYDPSWEAQAKEFEQIKQEQGFTVVSLLAQKTDSPDSIKSKIKEYYKSAEKLTYVIFIGKNIQSYTSTSTHKESDAMYAYLDQSSTYDIFVSRITGTKKEHFDYQFSKIKLYPTLKFSETYMKRFVSGTDSKKVTSQPADDELIRTMQAKFNKKFPITPRMVIANSPSAKITSQLFDEINQGCGFYQFAGDGSGTSEYQVGFDVNNIKNISFTKPFFTYEAACVNGDWKGISTCFADAIMWLDNNRGAISMYSSAPNAEWDPPMYIMTKGYDMFVDGSAKTIALAYQGANMACFHEGHSEKYTMEGYGIFGDLTLDLPWME